MCKPATRQQAEDSCGVGTTILPMQAYCDQSIDDEVWWFSEYAEFEDFVGIGKLRTLALVANLRYKVTQEILDRLRVANGLCREDEY